MNNPLWMLLPWAVGLAVSLCGCASISRSFLPKEYKEICDKRTASLNPNSESTFKVLNEECLRMISEEVGRAKQSYSEYAKIHETSNKDSRLRKEFEESKRSYEQEKIAKPRKTEPGEWDPQIRGCKKAGEICLSRSTGLPISDFTKELRFQSYKDWIANYKYKDRINATGWTEVKTDIQELIKTYK